MWQNDSQHTRWLLSFVELSIEAYQNLIHFSDGSMSLFSRSLTVFLSMCQHCQTGSAFQPSEYNSKKKSGHKILCLIYHPAHLIDNHHKFFVGWIFYVFEIQQKLSNACLIILLILINFMGSFFGCNVPFSRCKKKIPNMKHKQKNNNDGEKTPFMCVYMYGNTCCIKISVYSFLIAPYSRRFRFCFFGENRERFFLCMIFFYR
jgi:hypothetical protein